MTNTRVAIIAGLLIGAAFCVGIARAEARAVPLPTPLPTIVKSACPGGFAGCYDWNRNLAYIGTGDSFTRYHEIGHAFDDVELSEGERNRFRALIGQPRLGWRIPIVNTPKVPMEGPIKRASGAEQFADAYANCMLRNGILIHIRGGGITSSWSQSTPYAPPLKVHAQVCAFIGRAAR